MPDRNSHQPRRWVAPFFLLIFLVLLSGCAVPGAASSPDAITAPGADAGTVIDPPKPLADFTLTSHTGAPLRLSDLRGRPVLLFFGYTHCPDVCPLTMAEWKKVKQSLGDAASQVAFVFVSVDGRRDTPEVLARFVGRFDPAFVGLTGDDAAIRAVGQDYGLYFKHHDDHAENAEYLVDHASPSYLIDSTGQLRMIYSYGVSPDAITSGIQKLLSQQAGRVPGNLRR